MKKMLVIVLAMVAFSAQSYAAGVDRESKSRAERDRETRDTEARAARGGSVSGAISHVGTELSKSNLDSKLSPDEAHKLQVALAKPANEDLAKAGLHMLKLSKANRDLALMGVEGLQQIAKMREVNAKRALPVSREEEVAQQAYEQLILGAMEQAITTPATAKVVEDVARVANEGLAKGETAKEAMTKAVTKLKADTKSTKTIAELMEELKRLCAKKA